VSYELSLADRIGFSRAEAQRLVVGIPADTTSEIPINTQQLIVALSESHRIAVFRMSELRVSAPRASGKRRRKRDLTRAVYSGAFGVGMLYLNLLVNVAELAWSYAVSMGALYQAGRDIVGERA
jgi:hypothetical protein